VGDKWETEEAKRYIRLNPDLGKDPPPMDAKEEMVNMQLQVQKQLKAGRNIILVQQIAHRLIASSFYLQKIGKATRVSEENYRCRGIPLPPYVLLGGKLILLPGKIRCRFDNGSNDIRTLGSFFRRQQIEKFQPAFVVKVQYNSDEEYEVSGPRLHSVPSVPISSRRLMGETLGK
jgi:hypothetical protein